MSSLSAAAASVEASSRVHVERSAAPPRLLQAARRAIHALPREPSQRGGAMGLGSQSKSPPPTTRAAPATVAPSLMRSIDPLKKYSADWAIDSFNSIAVITPPPPPPRAAVIEACCEYGSDGSIDLGLANQFISRSIESAEEK